jgi:hypothetical protein
MSKECPNSITIDGQRYDKAESDGERMRLVIVDNRGLMFVGKTNLEPDERGNVLIRDARCVIYWGTTQHIAEMVNGPTPKTKLGAVADIYYKASNMVAYYNVSNDWAVKR